MGSLRQAIFHTTDLVHQKSFSRNFEIILLPQFDSHKDIKKFKNLLIALTATVPLPGREINYF